MDKQEEMITEYIADDSLDDNLDETISENSRNFSLNIEENSSIRLDKFLSDTLEGFTRSHIQNLIDDGAIIVNGSDVKSNYKPKKGDMINITLPDMSEPEIIPEDIPLDIIYEDSDVIVINKPKNMVVHPAPGHYTGTVVNALMYHCKDLSGINGVLRPGIVHRIDKDTTGLLVCAKNDMAHNSLAAQFKEHSITRKYHAIAVGRIKETDGTVNKPIGRSDKDRKVMCVNAKISRNAVTHYHVIEKFEKYSYIECVLETGRTHQIRVHMRSIDHPLLGDIVYGGKRSEYKLNGNPLNGQTLHAKTLGFVHPATGQYMEFDSELPEYFIKLLDKFRN